MNRLDVTLALSAALFASFQRSDAPAADVVATAIRRAVRQFGICGCASRMAQEFGDHPEVARDRMRWVLQLAGEAAARSRPPATQPAAANARRAA